jgi:hypothetical protein
MQAFKHFSMERNSSDMDIFWGLCMSRTWKKVRNTVWQHDWFLILLFWKQMIEKMNRVLVSLFDSIRLRQIELISSYSSIQFSFGLWSAPSESNSNLFLVSFLFPTIHLWQVNGGFRFEKSWLKWVQIWS